MKPRGILVFALVITSSIAARAADTPSALESATEGWRDMLDKAGSELNGWTRLSIPPAPKGKLNPMSQWKLEEKTGTLICEGDLGHEWLRWDEEQGDCIYHVEWKFTLVEGKKGYNSGIYVRNSADATIWHQAQTGSASGGFLFGETPVDGQLKRVNIKPTSSRVKPAGEWNTFEITCKGKEISLWVNGAVTAVFESCDTPRGYLGLEAEGYRIEFKNVKVKKIPK